MQEGNTIHLSPKQEAELKWQILLPALPRALVQNMVIGVTQGFERKLILVGVGYRAQAQGNVYLYLWVFLIRLNILCLKELQLKPHPDRNCYQRN